MMLGDPFYILVQTFTGLLGLQITGKGHWMQDFVPGSFVFALTWAQLLYYRSLSVQKDNLCENNSNNY